MLRPLVITDKDKIETTLLTWLDEVLETELGISDQDSEYDLIYITQKAAQCAKALETVANVQAKLTRVGLAVTRAAHKAGVAARLYASGVGQDGVPPTEGEQKHLLEMADAKDTWVYLEKVARETSKAAGDRMQLMRRLDSGLRLQHKLLEARVAAGATPAPGFTGSEVHEETLGDLDS